MKLIDLKKTKDGKYLKQYELVYLNKAGRQKRYEMVSRRELRGTEDLGKTASGVSIVAFREEKLLLLQEFRMSVNRMIYNLCAGMLEDGESPEACVRRELYEETGLSVSRIRRILPPSYAAVGISDVKTYIAFVDVAGSFADHTSENEQIKAGFYSREEAARLLETEEFSSRSQTIAYFFSQGFC